MKKTLLGSLLLTGLLAFFSQAHAVSVPFTLTGSKTTGMGFQPGYNGPQSGSFYDWLTVDGRDYTQPVNSSNTTNYASPYISNGIFNTGSGTTQDNVKIADLKFDVGYNAWAAHDSYGFLNPLSITIGGTTATIKIPYKIHIDYKDTLWLYATNIWLKNAANTVSYAIRIDPVTFYDKSSGSYYADLNADIRVGAVPLPPAFLLMLSGLGLLGFGAKRKKAAQAAA